MGKGIFYEHKKAQVTYDTQPATNDKVWIDQTSGIIYNYDGTRNVWLSTAKHTFEFARKGSAKGIYLPLLGDLEYSDDVYMAGRQAAIIGIFCRSYSGENNAGFEIRINEEIVYEFYYNGTTRLYINNELDITIQPYDKIQVYVKKIGSGVTNTVCRIETAWRYDV